MSTANIYERIALVMRDVQYVQKDAEVGFGNNKYSAVSHDRVVSAVREACINHGILVVPSFVSDEVVDCVTSSGKPKIRYQAVYDISFINTATPDERITLRVSSHADDNGDKAPGKAITYATKSAILKVFMLQTGEDDEQRFEDEQEASAASKAAHKESKAEWLREQAANIIGSLAAPETTLDLKRLMDSHRPLIKQIEAAGLGQQVELINSSYEEEAGKINARTEESVTAAVSTMAEAVSMNELEKTFAASYRALKPHQRVDLERHLIATKDAAKARIQEQAK